MLTAAFLAVTLGSVSCGSAYYVESGAKNFDVAADAGVEFPAEAFDFGDFAESAPDEETSVPNFVGDENSFEMRVVDKMPVYKAIGDTSPIKTLYSGSTVILGTTDDPDWCSVTATSGQLVGYTNEGFLRAINEDCDAFGELPIEYGKARTLQNTYVDAYSHLVDIRKVPEMLLFDKSLERGRRPLAVRSQDIDEALDRRNIDRRAVLPPQSLYAAQYDTLQMLKKAIEKFRADGYTIVIYDAYRPTSVQQRWFDIIRVHKWVADPSRGYGGVHDRGVAIDMSLIDRDGNELEMPTPMHTFTDESARSNDNMSEEARKNMDYMTYIMQSCGFSYINSEWWHFQDKNVAYYLPTDHPIDDIPLVPSEPLR